MSGSHPSQGLAHPTEPPSRTATTDHGADPESRTAVAGPLSTLARIAAAAHQEDIAADDPAGGETGARGLPPGHVRRRRWELLTAGLLLGGCLGIQHGMHVHGPDAMLVYLPAIAILAGFTGGLATSVGILASLAAVLADLPRPTPLADVVGALIAGVIAGVIAGLLQRARAQRARLEDSERQLRALTSTLAEQRAALQQAVERMERVQQELKQRARELERSNADLEQFAAVASHDLKEPLRMVSGFLDIIHRRYADRFDPQGLEFLALARDGAVRMARMIDGIMSYARLARPAVLQPAVASGRVLDETLAMLAPRIEEAHAVVRVDSLPTVAADAVQLGQVFQNLIGNALKFCRGRTPRIEIGASEVDDDWVFSVRDNGMGIPDEHQGRIFEMFRRHHAHEGIPGTGIGLATCRRIVENHGGAIWLESAVDRGTTFYFSLPKHHPRSVVQVTSAAG